MIVDNAHDYLDLALKTTIDISCGPNGLRTYDACFNFLSWEYEVYIHSLKKASDVDEGLLGHLIWSKIDVPRRSDVISRPRSDVNVGDQVPPDQQVH